MPPGGTRTPGDGDEWLALAILAASSIGAAVWAGAQLSSLVSAGRTLDVSLTDALRAAIKMPGSFSHPAEAWPAEVREGIAGPLAYWSVTSLVLAGVVVLAAGIWLRAGAGRIGTQRRRRLGVEVGARLASRRNVSPLVVDGPTSGRFILGSVGRRLVATENSAAPTRGRLRGARAGDRSAVAVIGPTRSGKTATVIAGILDWDGPAILSSVQNDLFDATVRRRVQLGDVYLFDPMRTIPDPLPEGVMRCGWSPLHSARTVSGAMEAANLLMEAAPSEGVTNANYWSRKGEALLWPMLFAAAIANRTMADVVRWLAVQDGSKEHKPASEGSPKESGVDPAMARGEMRALLVEATKDPDDRIAIQAQHALAQFDGFWHLDPRTRSDIYSTSQTLVQPWEDPYVSFASTRDAGPVIDLRALLSGRNTLYVVQPLKSTQRFSVVFGGVLGALLKDQAYEVAKRYRKPLPDLLCVIDEAGNTPLRWLPEVASTCAGIGVLLVTVWQSKAQIDAIYQAQAGPVLTNHGSKVIFAGVSDVETLEYVSYLAGEEEVAQRSSSADAHLLAQRRGVTDSTVHRRLMPAEVLRQARPGQAVLFHGTLPPAHLVGRRSWLDRRLSVIASGDGEKPAKAKAPADLLAALLFDPTPPMEVLGHLPAYTPSEADVGSADAEPASQQADRPDHGGEPTGQQTRERSGRFLEPDLGREGPGR